MGEELTKKERVINEQGLVSVLKQILDDLDAAVFDAYGWPHDLSDEEILQRLVDLNPSGPPKMLPENLLVASRLSKPRRRFTNANRHRRNQN